jgi:O-antigen ligase
MPIGPSPILLPALAACCAPALLAYNLPPSPTVFNQIAALAGWGWFIAAGGLIAGNRSAARSLAIGAPLALALALVAAAAIWSCTAGTLPDSLGWPSAGLTLATLGMVLAGASTQREGRRQLTTAFFVGWLTAGVLSAGIGLVQVFVPGLSDGNLIATSSVAGRAVGNLRQPNHLSSLLLWSAIALIPLAESARLPRSAAAGLMALLMVGVELTGSRTGLVGVAVLGLWGLLDRRLSANGRLLLLGAPLAYGACALLLALHASTGDADAAIGVASKLAVTDISSSRFGIWANTLALIRMHPWAGVGFGEFNFAWTLTPFPGRPVAFFDHTHNLPLQLAVELGLPLAALILALLCRALWRAWRAAARSAPAEGAAMHALFVMVLTMALHSQLEYPLWYAYFLLPTAWAWGLCLGAADGPAPPAGPASRSASAWSVVGLAMMLSAGLALADYLRVVRIFAPPIDAAPLAQRIGEGQRSLLFGHHADYAAATTTAEAADPVMPARASHYLLDARLLVAWSRAYAAAGDFDKARYLAQRLREFNNPQAAEFFAVCDSAVAAGKAPYPCDTTPSALTWRDFAR